MVQHNQQACSNGRFHTYRISYHNIAGKSSSRRIEICPQSDWGCMGGGATEGHLEGNHYPVQPYPVPGTVYGNSYQYREQWPAVLRIASRQNDGGRLSGRFSACRSILSIISRKHGEAKLRDILINLIYYKNIVYARTAQTQQRFSCMISQ